MKCNLLSAFLLLMCSATLGLGCNQTKEADLSEYEGLYVCTASNYDGSYGPEIGISSLCKIEESQFVELYYDMWEGKPHDLRQHERRVYETGDHLHFENDSSVFNIIQSPDSLVLQFVNRDVAYVYRKVDESMRADANELPTLAGVYEFSWEYGSRSYVFLNDSLCYTSQNDLCHNMYAYFNTKIEGFHALVVWADYKGIMFLKQSPDSQMIGGVPGNNKQISIQKKVVELPDLDMDGRWLVKDDRFDYKHPNFKLSDLKLPTNFPFHYIVFDGDSLTHERGKSSTKSAWQLTPDGKMFMSHGLFQSVPNLSRIKEAGSNRLVIESPSRGLINEVTVLELVRLSD